MMGQMSRRVDQSVDQADQQVSQGLKPAASATGRQVVPTFVHNFSTCMRTQTDCLAGMRMGI